MTQDPLLPSKTSMFLVLHLLFPHMQSSPITGVLDTIFVMWTSDRILYQHSATLPTNTVFVMRTSDRILYQLFPCHLRLVPESDLILSSYETSITRGANGRFAAVDITEMDLAQRSKSELPRLKWISDKCPQLQRTTDKTPQCHSCPKPQPNPKT